MHDLMVVQGLNAQIADRMPVIYNYFLQGGYFVMPSARTGVAGEISLGYSSVPPYRNVNARFQLLDCLEITGNYRIFRGVPDPVLGGFGFGDFSDKGANIKFALLRPEDSDYELPGLAFGLDDFIGTRSFSSKYIVLTHVLLNCSLEASIGYGFERINGFFRRS